MDKDTRNSQTSHWKKRDVTVSIFDQNSAVSTVFSSKIFSYLYFIKSSFVRSNLVLFGTIRWPCFCWMFALCLFYFHFYTTYKYFQKYEKSRSKSDQLSTFCSAIHKIIFLSPSYFSLPQLRDNLFPWNHCLSLFNSSSASNNMFIFSCWENIKRKHYWSRRLDALKRCLYITNKDFKSRVHSIRIL